MIWFENAVRTASETARSYCVLLNNINYEVQYIGRTSLASVVFCVCCILCLAPMLHCSSSKSFILGAKYKHLSDMSIIKAGVGLMVRCQKECVKMTDRWLISA